jgi:hypothetical protein
MSLYLSLKPHELELQPESIPVLVHAAIRCCGRAAAGYSRPGRARPGRARPGRATRLHPSLGV